jgi:hypothetical protein
MTKAQDDGTSRTPEVHNLAAAATTLLERGAADARRSGGADPGPGAGAALKQTLLAFLGGVHLAEHDVPGPATLQVLQGRVRLVASEESWELGAGAGRSHADPVHPAPLESLEDAAVLFTVVAT